MSRKGRKGLWGSEARDLRFTSSGSGAGDPALERRGLEWRRSYPWLPPAAEHLGTWGPGDGPSQGVSGTQVEPLMPLIRLLAWGLHGRPPPGSRLLRLYTEGEGMELRLCGSLRCCPGPLASPPEHREKQARAFPCPPAASGAPPAPRCSQKGPGWDWGGRPSGPTPGMARSRWPTASQTGLSVYFTQTAVVRPVLGTSEPLWCS